jgi:RNA polymerase sigma-70 factor (ECF subfamily)
VQGDRRCFEKLVSKYEMVIFSAAVHMVGDPEDAKDITQNAFLKAYQNLKSYDPKRKFFSWIYKIAVNESRNLLGRRKPCEALSDHLVSRLPSPGEDCELRQLKEIVRSAVMRLSPDYREVLVLRHFIELSYREIAELIGIPEKTVKSRLYSARRQLCDILLP